MRIYRDEKHAKISLLIFSANKVSEVISLAKEMYRVVDEIVIISSSERERMDRLEIERRKNRLDRVSIFHTVNLGYSEPFREYGISKCKNEWILLLDAGEKPSVHLRTNLRRIVDNADFDTLDIKTFEHALSRGLKGRYFTWQARLFRKGSVQFMGLVREIPATLGRVKRLESDTEYIIPIDEGQQESSYNKMDLFSPNGLLILIIRDLMLGLIRGEMSLNYLTSTLKVRMDLENQRASDKSIENIGKIIQAKGVIRYLQLDRESVIKKLDRKYSNKKKQGVDLLIKLLKDKYGHRYP